VALSGFQPPPFLHFITGEGTQMAYQIKYLKLGGILDQAIQIVKNHFGLLFSIMMLLLVPFELVQGFVELAGSPQIPIDATFEEQMEIRREVSPYNLLLRLLQFPYLLVVIPVTNAAVIHAVARLYLGQDVTAVEAVKYGFSRLVPLIGTSILMYLAIVGGLILLIIPGILFALWFSLSMHVVVIEGTSGSAALGRSRRLVRPHLGTYLVLGIVLAVIFIGLMMISLLIPQPHLQVFAYVALSAVATIVWTAALTVFYFSCRCAEENFDLHFLAESLAAEQGAAGEGDPRIQPNY
jgi:hypothetical protein